MKINLLLAAVFLSVIIYANINEIHGIVGLTKLDGSTGCICHNFELNDSVMVWIEGPDTVYVNDTTDYIIKMIGGPAVTGGFNVAVRFGAVDSTDSTSRIISDQLAHSFPKSFTNDTVFWNFKYISPDSILSDTIYSVANSVNGDSIPGDEDQWNFGENFSVFVADKPTIVINDSEQPSQFILHQNYPNPFNPTTSIKFTILDLGFTSLIVYDILGNEVAVLVNENLAAGEYEFNFNAANLTSGVYIYKLTTPSFSQSKKMVLLK